MDPTRTGRRLRPAVGKARRSRGRRLGKITGKLPILIRTMVALGKAGIAEREIDLYQKEALAGDFR